MGRPRKSGAEKIADILAKFNIQTDEPIEVPENDYNHNNAVAVFARAPEHFVVGVCRHCESKFAHNQPIPAGTRVGYCSDTCRKLDFEKSTGIKWGSVENPKRANWDGDPPMIITPEQYDTLAKIADWFNRNRTGLQILDPEPTVREQLDPEESLFPTEEHLEYPLGTVVADYFSLFAQENQYPVEAHTNSQQQHAFSGPLQTEPEDAIFDFE